MKLEITITHKFDQDFMRDLFLYFETLTLNNEKIMNTQDEILEHIEANKPKKENTE